MSEPLISCGLTPGWSWGCISMRRLRTFGVLMESLLCHDVFAWINQDHQTYSDSQGDQRNLSASQSSGYFLNKPYLDRLKNHLRPMHVLQLQYQLPSLREMVQASPNQAPAVWKMWMLWLLLIIVIVLFLVLLVHLFSNVDGHVKLMNECFVVVVLLWISTVDSRMSKVNL